MLWDNHDPSCCYVVYVNDPIGLGVSSFQKKLTVEVPYVHFCNILKVSRDKFPDQTVIVVCSDTIKAKHQTRPAVETI
jgi:hypothetical protein